MGVAPSGVPNQELPMRSLVSAAAVLSTVLGASPSLAADGSVRVATFNCSLNRNNAGQLITDLSTPANAQAKVIAEIIQRAAPDIVLLNEFDYDSNDTALDLFRANYLAISQNGAAPINYPYAYTAPSNTGVPSGFDLDNNGSVGGGNDAFGFGFFPGQFGMAIYSKYPIDESSIRTFQNFLWKDMPGALLPDDANTAAPEEPLGCSGDDRRHPAPCAREPPDAAGLRRSGGSQWQAQS
jgi:hypothetical protein